MMKFFGDMQFYDATNSDARSFGANILRQNYGKHGIVIMKG